MKNILLALTIITFFTSCKKTETLAPDTYQINASAKGVYNGIRAYLTKVDDKRRPTIIDTAIVMNETFTFYGKIDHTTLNHITINGVKGILPIIIEPGNIIIEINKDNLVASKLSGSKNNEDYYLFKEQERKKTLAVIELKQKAKSARQSGDIDLYTKLSTESIEIKQELALLDYTFIKEHPDSDISLLLLEKMMQNKNQSSEAFSNSFSSLKNVVNKNDANKQLGKKIEDYIYVLESKKNLEIGKIAPNFSSTTPSGETLTLNDIKGKATIIDFWAAWCGPCRRENPNVVKVYEKYHDKGLEIISVSLDGNRRQKDPKAAWLKAIDDDKLNWHHVSSLKYFNDPVAKLYSISSIPATYILDKDGKIVAKKLRGEALEKQIAALLD